MNDKLKELLHQAKGSEVIGTHAKVPELRAGFVDEVIRRNESGFPEAMSVLKLTLAGAALSVTVAFGMTVLDQEERQNDAAMVWGEPGTEEGQ